MIRPHISSSHEGPLTQLAYCGAQNVIRSRALLAMSADFFHAMCSSKAVGTEFLAHREKSEVTRHNSTCQLSPVPMKRRIGPLHTADIIPLAEQGFGKY